MSSSWRTGGWLVASAVLWLTVGVGATLLFQREGGADGAGDRTSELSAALQVLDLSDQQRQEVDQVLTSYGTSVLSLHQPVEEAQAAVSGTSR